MAMDGGRSGTRGLSKQEEAGLRRETMVLACVLLGVAAVVTLLMLGSLLVTHLRHPQERLGSELLVFSVAIVVIWVVTLLFLRRWRSQSPVARARMAGIDKATRQRVRRALVRGEAIAEGDRPLAAAMAQRTREDRFSTVLFPAISVIAALTAVLGFVQVGRGGGSIGLAVMQGALALVWGALAFTLHRDRCRIAATAAGQAITDGEVTGDPR